MTSKIRDWGTLVTVLSFFIFQWTKVERHETTINAWQTVGTPTVVAMKATYDERFKNDQERIKRLEDLAVSNATGIQDIKSELREASVKLATIKEQLADHMRETKGGK